MTMLVEQDTFFQELIPLPTVLSRLVESFFMFAKDSVFFGEHKDQEQNVFAVIQSIKWKNNLLLYTMAQVQTIVRPVNPMEPNADIKYFTHELQHPLSVMNVIDVARESLNLYLGNYLIGNKFEFHVTNTPCFGSWKYNTVND
jgi:hypothetical protein